MLDTPIFVGGAGSSGSSLLAIMLNRHPDIYCGNEMSLFNKSRIYDDFKALKKKLPEWLKVGLPTNGYFLYPNILPYADCDLVKPDVLSRAASESKNLRQFVDSIQTYCLRESNKNIFGEKTPSNAYCFRQLAALYPNCLLVHSVRDGRDTVCSLMRRGFGIFSATSLWLYNTACAISCRNLPNYFEYKYEDLVRDPSPILQQICERTSIPFDERMLKPQEGEKAPNPASAWKSSPTDQINQRSVGRFQTDLSDADYALFSGVQLTVAGVRQSGVNQRYTALELLHLLGYLGQPPKRQPKWTRAKFLAMRDNTRRNLLLIRRRRAPRRALTTYCP